MALVSPNLLSIRSGSQWAFASGERSGVKLSNSNNLSCHHSLNLNVTTIADMKCLKPSVCWESNRVACQLWNKKKTKNCSLVNCFSWIEWQILISTNWRLSWMRLGLIMIIFMLVCALVFIFTLIHLVKLRFYDFMYNSFSFSYFDFRFCFLCTLLIPITWYWRWIHCILLLALYTKLENVLLLFLHICFAEYL